jgi:cytochrome c
MKYFIVCAGISFLVACGAGTGETSKSDSTNRTQDLQNIGGTNVDTAENISGSQLIAGNDCLTCHKIDEKSTGPSYKDVANRYENNQGNVENLANKIIKGGKGLWGHVAMTPHPNLPEPQAEEMVRYILSLRDTSGTAK